MWLLKPVRTWKVLTFAAMIGAILAGFLIVTDSRGRAMAQSPPIPSFVAGLASQVAGNFGDPVPVAALAIQTNRLAAVRATAHADVPDSGPVVLVVLTGSFVDDHALVPPGAAAPIGSVLAFTVDPNTQEILDVSLGDQPVDFSPIGVPRALNLPSPAP
jgi:hypothetical protein